MFQGQGVIGAVAEADRSVGFVDPRFEADSTQNVEEDRQQSRATRPGSSPAACGHTDDAPTITGNRLDRLQS
jgi:hypothetical protein